MDSRRTPRPRADSLTSPSHEITGSLRDLNLSQKVRMQLYTFAQELWQPARRRMNSVVAKSGSEIARPGSVIRSRPPLQPVSTPLIQPSASVGNVAASGTAGRSPKRSESPNPMTLPSGKKPRAQRRFLDELDATPTPVKGSDRTDVREVVFSPIYRDAPPLPPLPPALPDEAPPTAPVPPADDKENGVAEKKRSSSRRRASVLQTVMGVFKNTPAQPEPTSVLREALQADPDICIDKVRKVASKLNQPVYGATRKILRWILLNPESDELQMTERFLLTMPDFGFTAQAVHKELRDVYADSKVISANEQRMVSQLIFTFYEKWAKVLVGDILTRTLLGAVPLVDDLFSDNLHDTGSRILALSRTLNASPRAMQGVQRNINISVLSVLSFSSADAAKALTASDRELFVQVMPDEWLSVGWTKPHFAQVCPVLFHLVDRFNRMSPWICSELAVAPEDKRGKVLSKLIRIASRCMEMGSYNAVMAIIAALSQGVVNNQIGWQRLSSKRTKEWERLEKRMDMSANFQNYRTAVRRSTPVMPYIGLYCKDLAVMGEVLPTFIDGALNTAKFIFFGGLLLELRDAQNAAMQGTPSAEAAAYFSALPCISTDTAQAVLERSRK